MSPVFSDENLIWNRPDFSYKEMVYACAASSEKHVFFPLPE